MAMIKPECGGCEHHLEVTDGCLRIGHGMSCMPSYTSPAWKGDVDEPHAPTAAELEDLYRDVVVDGVAIGKVHWPEPGGVREADLMQATANAMLQSAFEKQVGGSHYKDMAIQPVEYILANKLGFVEGAVVKYVSRWPAKGGVQDLKKARHLLDLLIETLEEPKPSP